MDNEDQTIEPGAAGAPEGAPTVEPTTDDVAKMYDELGIKAPAPTGATKGRPKSSDVRAKNVSDKDDADTKPGRKKEVNGEDKSNAASAPAKDGDAGDGADKKGSKVGEDSGKLSEESEEADGGIRKNESEADRDSKRGSEKDADAGADGTRQAADESDDEAETDEDIEGKRPGKSNPKIEQRFQRLTEEKREAIERAERLEQQLQEATQKQEQAKIAQEDPEYTIDDFRKVRDEEGNVIDLDPERAELAWRRWKDGYDARSEEREAAHQHEIAENQRREEMSEQIMRQSVEAYDELTSLMDDFPELVSTSGKFDEGFAAKAMPIINESLIYAPGTEPGNAEGNQPVIMGLKLNPRIILDALKGVREEKRSLPLNGLSDNVETRSNVSVPHSRSSDPTVHAANALYKELGIDKRI